MNTQEISVLYVDDEENNLISFKASLRRKYKIFTAISAKKALEILAKEEIHVLITDQRMPEISGTELLEEVIKEGKDPIRLLLTGYTDMETVVEAVNKGKIYHYLTKPWNEAELCQTIESAYKVYLDKKKIEEMNRKLSQSNEQLEFLIRQQLLS